MILSILQIYRCLGACIGPHGVSYPYLCQRKLADAEALMHHVLVANTALTVGTEPSLAAEFVTDRQIK
ncbi:hypothetical protein BJV74DRAFT_846130 [Russula compacta]|nr:hypothetical protein BJV74DRAFT_846130 [Russula compacta]